MRNNFFTRLFSACTRWLSLNAAKGRLTRSYGYAGKTSSPTGYSTRLRSNSGYAARFRPSATEIMAPSRVAAEG